MTMDVPEFMPVLSAGAHDGPSEGACIMEMVSYLAGEKWSDRPHCTDPTLAAFERTINDTMADEDRYLLIPMIGRLFGTGDVWPTFDFRPAVGRFFRAAEDPDLARVMENGNISGPYEYTHAVASRLPNAAAKVALLSALIDEYDHGTGRTQHRHLTGADYRDLVALTK